MKQVFYIHGGTLAKNNDELYNTIQKREINPFEIKKRWRNSLQERLPEYQVIKPDFPNKEMACYKIRKLWFEKHFPYLTGDEIILIGHSLGAGFLMKYFSENTPPFKVSQLHIISPFLNEEGLPEGDNYIGDFKYNIENIKTITGKASKVFIWHSKDDPVIPFFHSETIIKYIPSAKFMVFEDRQHFNQEEFPELIECIKNN